MDNNRFHTYYHDIINTLALAELKECAAIYLRNIPHTVLSEKTDEGVPIRKLFIGNLAARTTNKDLEKVFSDYGKVESCYLKRSNNKSNFAFITFAQSIDALKVREAACGMGIRLHCRLLRVSPADSWHQPDSAENRRKFLSNNEIGCDEKPQEEGNNDDALINLLNDYCLMEIFLYLPIADRIRMERVCKRWLAVSRESWRAVKKLDLSSATWGLNKRIGKQSVDTSALRKVLLRCGNFLNQIDFSHPHILGSSALTIVGKFCPNLQIIDISYINLSQAGIHSLLQNCQNITKFAMKALTGPCEKDLLELFVVNKNIKSFKIARGHHISGKCLLHLPCETMEELDLHNGISILPCHMNAAIQRFDSLRTLSLSFCVGLNDSTFHAIGTRKTLTKLSLFDHFPIASVVGMRQIAQLYNLESLTIRKNYLLNDEILHLLAANCKRLSHLDIYGCTSVTDAGLASIPTLPNLHHLVISYIRRITGEALTRMKNLRTLECHRCDFLQDSVISTLIKMAPDLQLLDLSNCQITNVTLEVAIRVTKQRMNNTILKIIVGNTFTNLSEITEVSPLLQIVNVSLDRTLSERSVNHEERLHELFY